MLNCFKDYKRYIHILNHISNLAWPKWMKLSLEQHYMLYVLHSQYHACWCTGDFRSQCISRHDIDLQSRNIPSPASEELRWVWNWLCQSGTQIFCHRHYLYTLSFLMDLQYPEKYFCLWPYMSHNNDDMIAFVNIAILICLNERREINLEVTDVYPW